MFENISTRCRAIVAFLFALVALLLFTACCHMGQGWFSLWYGLPVGGALMLLSIPLHWMGEKNGCGYVACFLFNTAGMGFCASAYYSMTGISAALDRLLPALALPLAILLVGCVLFTLFPQAKQPIVAVLIMLEIGLLIATVVFFIKRGGDFYAFSLFSLLIACFYTAVYGLTVDEEERDILRDISFGSYGAFLLVGVAALVAVACISGDGCDFDDGCCDCCDCTGVDCNSSGKVKKKK